MTDLETEPRSMAAIVAKDWRNQPLAEAVGRASGISAARFRWRQTAVSEITTQPLTGMHILSVLQGRFQADTFHDGRYVSGGRLTCGMVNFVPAGVTPRAVLYDGVDMLHIYLSRATVVQIAELADLNASGLELIDPANRLDPVIARYADEILREMASGDALARLRLDVLGQELTIALLRRWSNRSTLCGRMSRPGTALAPWQLRRITAKLADEIDRNVGLDELAILVGLSPTYLCSAFRRSTGMPPHQWQKQLRIDRAKALLEESRLSVTEIALEVGYGNPGHFATLFKAATGFAPRDWRRARTP